MGVQLHKSSHKVFFIILLPMLSAGITYVLNIWLKQYIPEPWSYSLGILGVYTIIYQIFNKSLWQFVPQGLFEIVTVPNLNGSWIGQLNSSHDNNTTSYNVRVEVIQSFSSIKVFAYFDRSVSYSVIAGFDTEKDGRKVLHYIYKNEPRNNAAPTMQGHYGASKHEYIASKDTMECYYYNEPPRERGHYGKFNVKRRKRKLKRILFPTLAIEFK